MPELLVYTRALNDLDELSLMADQTGFRLKHVVDIESAGEWVRLRSYDAVFVNHEISVADQEILGDALWRKRPDASLIVYSLSPEVKMRDMAARLFGAEQAYGQSARKFLLDTLEGIASAIKAGRPILGVLVVEDLDSPRDIICAYMEARGVKDIVGVSSASEALEELRAAPERFGCVLSDIRMPHMTGKDLVRAVRHDETIAKVPIVMLTAYGSVESLIDCLKAGATGFLLKPPKLKDLQREIFRAFNIKRRGSDPRIASSEEADQIRDILIAKGFV